MKKQFICATKAIGSFEDRIPAPLFRRAFSLDFTPKSASVSVCGLGFYRLFVNGKEVTKGYLAPYISNPTHYCYYDTYEIASLLQKGENCFGVMLGNGFQNPFGGAVWDFDKAAWRGAPMLALSFTAEGKDGRLSFDADERFLTHDSPILFDEYRMGEIYDARLALDGWSTPDFDAADWKPALIAAAPKGKLALCTAEPIREIEHRTPVSVTETEEGYLYDFGKNTAGTCRLHLKGATRGQTVVIRLCERLENGKFDQSNIIFDTKKYPFYVTDYQRIEYRAKGEAEEVYEPSFAYFGYRYALVTGIDEAQATKDLLSYPVLSSDLRTLGGFACSDETVMRIYEIVRNADRSNFYYFPTDCPHREKNGWTGDASFSSLHMTLLYDTTDSYLEWLRNIVAEQREDGALPGVVPTGGWGYAWGNGPAWDSVLFRLPYVLYHLRGNTEGISLTADAMMRYLRYIASRRNEDGTVAVGLGDWVPVGLKGDAITTPLVVTDSIMVMDIARKAAEMLHAIGRTEDAAYAEALFADMRDRIRRVLIDAKTLTVHGATQSAQSMALYYGVFDPAERETAFAVLLDLIEKRGGNFDCGFLGIFTLFHVLTAFGRSDIAYRMITQKEFPSYRNLLDRGETAMVEAFRPEGTECGSHNHHFLGDVVRWFIGDLAGLYILHADAVRIAPSFLPQLDSASAYYELPSGRVSVSWERVDGAVTLTYSAPSTVSCDLSGIPQGVKVIRS